MQIPISYEAENYGLWGTVQKLLRPVFSQSSRKLNIDELRPADSDVLLPLDQRVAVAFETLPPSEIEERLITALIKSPDADSKTLSNACGWKSAIWHTHFGLMCQKRITWLWPSTLPGEPNDQFLQGLLAEYDLKKGSFRMKPEVVPVFRRMGLG